MLFLVLLLFLVLSVMLVAMKKEKHAWIILVLCITFLLMLTGIIIYFAKTGGLTTEQRQFFFLNNQIQQKISYLNLSLPQVGYMIAIGRYLFPMFLLLLSWEYNYTASKPKYKKYQWIIIILPALSLFIYYPDIFWNTFSLNSYMQKILILFMITWILIYVLFSIGLLLQEYFCATIHFSKKPFRNIIFFLSSVIFVYLCYAIQDPIQVYRMYSIEYSSFFARSYLQFISNVKVWYGVTILAVILLGVGFWNIQKYNKIQLDERKGELKFQRKIKDTHTVIPVFVHSIKNQILAEKIIEKQMSHELNSSEPDIKKTKDLLNQLISMNSSMMEHIEELYKNVKTSQIKLVPTSPGEILKMANERFRQKYPNEKIDYLCEETSLVLADSLWLGEAIGNLLTNAFEASVHRNPQIIKCTVTSEKLYLLIKIYDNGTGIEPQKRKKIFEPFYTSKNSNYNWGMGLAYVMQTVKEHFGMIKVESIPDKYTEFYVYIPLYKSSDKIN